MLRRLYVPDGKRLTLEEKVALTRGFAVIPGATSKEHIGDNLALQRAQFELSQEDEELIRSDGRPTAWREWENLANQTKLTAQQRAWSSLSARGKRVFEQLDTPAARKNLAALAHNLKKARALPRGPDGNRKYKELREQLRAPKLSPIQKTNVLLSSLQKVAEAGMKKGGQAKARGANFNLGAWCRERGCPWPCPADREPQGQCEACCKNQ